ACKSWRGRLGANESTGGAAVEQLRSANENRWRRGKGADRAAGKSRRGGLGAHEDTVATPLEQLRSAGETLHRHGQQADRAAEACIPRRRRRSGEDLARNGRQDQ